MSERRDSDAGRLRAWVVILALAFVAVALQQSHRYQRMRQPDADPVPIDARTAYRNSLHAFDFYCESVSDPDASCGDARTFLRAISRRRCPEAEAALRRVLDSSGRLPATTHPLSPPFLAVYERVCGDRPGAAPST